MNRICRSLFMLAAAAVLAAPVSVLAASKKAGETSPAPAAAAGHPSTGTSASPPIIPPRPGRTTRKTAPRAPVNVPTKASPLDLNTASPREIEALPGIGPARAKQIVDARPFASIADLSRAKLPKTTLDKITPLVTVSGAGSASRPTRPEPPPR